MATKRAIQPLQDLAIALPPDPLGEPERAAMQQALADITEDWCVELQGICADEANLVIVPEDGDDAHGPSFVISREDGGFRVDQVHWDALTEVGTYPSLSHVAAVLRSRLALCATTIVPAIVTIH